MKSRKLVLYRETVHQLDPDNLRLAAAGAAPSIPVAGVGTDTQPVPYRTTRDLSWCVSCQSNSVTYCFTDRSL